VLLIDDDQAFCTALKGVIAHEHPGLSLSTISDPVEGLRHIQPNLALLILDFEMPRLDGRKVMEYALAKGVPGERILILSGRSTDELHERFALGECLAVLNKTEPAQRHVLSMILREIERKNGPENPASLAKPSAAPS
ncbi:MAG: hypothetical protein A2V83_04670, partial [Nitrospirae bacterium RBG_16_64_22]